MFAHSAECQITVRTTNGCFERSYDEQFIGRISWQYHLNFRKYVEGWGIFAVTYVLSAPRPQTFNVIEKDTSTQVFFCEFWKNLRTTFL